MLDLSLAIAAARRQASAAALLAVLGAPAWSQATADPIVPMPFVGGLEQNSENCDVTFFTEGDDRIDFRSGRAGRCFDMLAGDDMLVVDRSGHPRGTVAHTGAGRDVVWASDGPDRIVDEGGDDDGIVTYGGDDVIEIELGVNKDPFREEMTTPRTRIRPGAGSNRILIGQGLPSDAFARISPDAWIWSDPDARDAVEADCGRPHDRRTYDLRVIEVPRTASVDIDAMGCGIALFGQLGDLRIDQVGGRFALRTEGDRIEAQKGGRRPELTGTVRAGTSAVIDLTQSAPSSSFSWQGHGEAVVRARLSDARDGGDFAFASAGPVLFEGDLGPSAASWSLLSTDRVALELTAGAAPTAEAFTVAAPWVDITWHADAGYGFPELLVGPAEIGLEDVERRDIEFFSGNLKEKARAMLEEAMGIVPPGGDDDPEALPEGVEDLSVSSRTASVSPGTVSLELVLSAPGVCHEALLVDVDGDLPTLAKSCGPGSSALSTLDAAGYERIEVSSPQGKVLVIEINGESGLRVDRLSIHL